jgi:uncharacterized protein DUF5670
MDVAQPRCINSPSMQTTVPVSAARRSGMWIGIAIVLLLLWVGGFVMFHVAGFFIHILLILAVISLILHFVFGRRSAA